MIGINAHPALARAGQVHLAVPSTTAPRPPARRWHEQVCGDIDSLHTLIDVVAATGMG